MKTIIFGQVLCIFGFTGFGYFLRRILIENQRFQNIHQKTGQLLKELKPISEMDETTDPNVLIEETKKLQVIKGRMQALSEAMGDKNEHEFLK